MGNRWRERIDRRETPQEHSHEKYITKTRQMLKLKNPDQIVDPLYGLLDNASGSAGHGSITDTDCLQQATADQAFTNAKDIGDIDGMTAALIYRALERNTNKVGLTSGPCTSVDAVNPEIRIVKQHQDPASDNAATINFNIVLNLAVQIASIGGDPTLALQSGTFAPGDTNDSTASGNTCDDPNDAEGCIYSQGLLVEDASVDDIASAVTAAGVDFTPPSHTPSSHKSDSGSLVKIIVPIITLGLLIVAGVGLYLWRRRRRRRIKVKAGWLTGKDKGNTHTTKKTERLDHPDDEERAGASARGLGSRELFPARAHSTEENAKRKTHSVRFVEPDHQSSQIMSGARAPGGLTASFSREDGRQLSKSKDGLRLNPTVKESNGEGSIGWKVFRGDRETRVNTWLRSWEVLIGENRPST